MSLLDVLGSRAQRSIADARHNVARLGRTIVTFSGSKVVFTASPSADAQKRLTSAPASSAAALAGAAASAAPGNASSANASSANGAPSNGSSGNGSSGSGPSGNASAANASSKKQPPVSVKISPPTAKSGSKPSSAAATAATPAAGPASAADVPESTASAVATIAPPDAATPATTTKPQAASASASATQPPATAGSTGAAPQTVKPPPILRPTSIPNAGSVAHASQPIFGPGGPPDEHTPATARSEWRRRNPDRLLQATNRLNWIAAAVVVIGLLNVAGLYYALHLTGNALNVAANVTSNQTIAVKTEQRAWIAPGSISLQAPYDRSHIGMTVALNNTGKTPATVDGVDIAVDAYDPRSNRRSQILERHIPSHTIAPSSHLSLPIAEVRPLSDGDFERILKRSVRHEFIVTVRYRDIFGDQHRTNFCNAVEGSAAEMSYGSTLSSCDPNTMD